MKKRRQTEPSRVPSSTYRLQFNGSFTFADATNLADYLAELGITDAYASPFLMARPGSTHGYDVTDPTRLNPEIGDDESLRRFSAKLKEHGMGMLVDVVPNHMCITHPSNKWWWDVLENGPSSRYARFFDIEWHPPKEELANKVLLPFLGDQFGRVLENKLIQVVNEEGKFEVAFYENRLPLNPRTWPSILDPAVIALRDRLGATHEYVQELESIIAELGHLPGITETDDARIHEREREKEIARRRLWGLIERSAEASGAIEASLADINGKRGEPRSFDRLERLLENQPYRLAHWRVAGDEINYRRFFDVNGLAAIRVEDPEVFSTVHTLIFDLVKQGHITGLRVDHPDGLWDPEKYFRYLQDGCRAQTAQAPNGNESVRARAERSFYVVAEKILIGSEPLRANWAIEGTTGYGFLNLLNGLFVDRSKQKAFDQIYRRFTGWSESFDDLMQESRRLILQTGMSSELNVLARRLDRISEHNRWFRDFTQESLRDALREVISTFPIYRSYIRREDTEVDPEDRRQILIAIREAKRRNPAISESIFDFIQGVLLLEHPEGLDDSQRAERHVFAMRLQQLTAPVMAKGLEDTAFYRYFPLASLNEVGGDPARFGVSVSAFHRRNLLREYTWPNTMNASSTHDTKRGEDVRARINVLSEMPREWYSAIRRWRDMNRAAKTKLETIAAPDANAEYLFYQTLVGTWPLQAMDASAHSAYVQRLQDYMDKALHEAKMHTSWINPNKGYDQAVRQFVARALDTTGRNQFLEDFLEFHGPIARAGIWNSLSQTLLKIGAPGVPDFYQGNELWAFDLVDPDNRRPVDYAARGKLLASLRERNWNGADARMQRLVKNPCDGAIKMYLMSRAVGFRRDRCELFAKGNYTPLNADGNRAAHAVSFARTLGDEVVIVVAGRFFLRLGEPHGVPAGEATWGNSVLTLPENMQRPFRDIFSGHTITPEVRDGKLVLPLATAFAHAPFAMLHSA